MKLDSLINDTDMLIEHLGNLEAIDKELVKGLMSSYYANSQMQGIGFKPDSHNIGKETWHAGSPRTTNKVAPAVGRNSTLVEKQLSISEATHALTEDLTVVGLIYKRNGKQVMLIQHDLFSAKAPNSVLSKRAGYKESNTYSWRMTKAFVRELHQNTQKFPPITSKKTVVSELNEVTKNAITGGKGTLQSPDKVSALFKILAISEWLKLNPEAKSIAKEPLLPKLEFIIIEADVQRGGLKKSRETAKQGIVPVPKTPRQEKMPNASYLSSSHNVYIRNLANHLKYRLNQHKNKKAGAFESEADMLKYFLDEGYLKKLIFMGVPYNLKDNRIDFDDLMLGPKSQGKSQIEYVSEKQLEWSDPRHKIVSQELKELAHELKSQAPPPPTWVKEKMNAEESDDKKAEIATSWQEAWAEDKARPKMAELYLKHKVEPTKILVKLVLDGGKIIPHRFEMEFSRF